MSGRKNILITLGFGLFVGLTASGGCVLLVSRYYSRLLFDLLNALCEAAAAREPEPQLPSHTRLSAVGTFTRGVMAPFALSRKMTP